MNHLTAENIHFLLLNEIAKVVKTVSHWTIIDREVFQISRWNGKIWKNESILSGIVCEFYGTMKAHGASIFRLRLFILFVSTKASDACNVCVWLNFRTIMATKDIINKVGKKFLRYSAIVLVFGFWNLARCQQWTICKIGTKNKLQNVYTKHLVDFFRTIHI